MGYRDLQTGEDERDRIDVKSLGEKELQAFAESLGRPAYRGRQLFKWLYGKGAVTFSSMSDLPNDFREELCREAHINLITLDSMQTAADETVKALFRLPSGRRIETVLIPDLDDATGEAKRLTVCVSSQVGCAMGCTFCATGQMGFQQNLTAGEIFDQVWFMNELAQERYGMRISNIVFMGMGEPLLNYDNVLKSIDLITHPEGLHLSPRRITVSTVGLARRIEKLADDEVRFNLAVSLHAPTDEKRSSIMPVNQATSTNLAALKEALQYYTRQTGQQITFEYCLFQGFNDDVEDARRLAEVTRWVPSKVNIIMYNSVDGMPFERTSEDRLDGFIQELIKHGVLVTVRRSRGQDIDAACGQLANKEKAAA